MTHFFLIFLPVHRWPEGNLESLYWERNCCAFENLEYNNVQCNFTCLGEDKIKGCELFCLSEENVLSSSYNMFQRARWEIGFKKFSKFSTLFESVKTKSNRSEKILFIWRKSVMPPSWQFCFKEVYTSRRTPLLLFWSRSAPGVKLEQMSAFMYILRGHR